MIGAALFELGKNLLGGFAQDWQQKREHKRKIAEAVTENKIRLAQSKQTHNQTWELAQIEGKDRALRRVSFALLSAPFVIGVVNPQAVETYFNVALAAVPEWYQWAYVSILGAIWGISEFKAWKS